MLCIGHKPELKFKGPFGEHFKAHITFTCQLCGNNYMFMRRAIHLMVMGKRKYDSRFLVDLVTPRMQRFGVDGS